MSFQITEKTKSQGADPVFIFIFAAVVVAVMASMAIRLAVSGGPSKARADNAIETPISSPKE